MTALHGEMTAVGIAGTTNNSHSAAEVRRLCKILAAAGLVALLVVACTAWAAGGDATSGGAVIFSLGALAVGAILGFLFGLPRIDGVEADARGLVLSSHLSEIAKWLTSAIVGASLIQASELSAAAYRVAIAAGPIFLGGEATPAKSAMAVGVLLFFFVLGFILFYLVTLFSVVLGIRDIIDDLRDEEAATVNSGPLDPKGSGPSADISPTEPKPSDTRAALGRVSQWKREELKQAEHFAAWGRARLAEGKVDDASWAFDRAVALKPEVIQYYFDRAAALFNRDMFREAATEYRRIVDLSTAGLPVRSDKDRSRALASLLLSDLYLDSGGAAQAKLDFDTFAGDKPDSVKVTPTINARMACAYGQLHAAAQGTGADSEADIFAAQAQKFIRETLREAPGWRSEFVKLLFELEPGENDLTSLRGDPEVGALLKIFGERNDGKQYDEK